jgi:hypothetical protein
VGVPHASGSAAIASKPPTKGTASASASAGSSSETADAGDEGGTHAAIDQAVVEHPLAEEEQAHGELRRRLASIAEVSKLCRINRASWAHYRQIALPVVGKQMHALSGSSRRTCDPSPQPWILTRLLGLIRVGVTLRDQGVLVLSQSPCTCTLMETRQPGKARRQHLHLDTRPA